MRGGVRAILMGGVRQRCWGEVASLGKEGVKRGVAKGRGAAGEGRKWARSAGGCGRVVEGGGE